MAVAMSGGILCWPYRVCSLAFGLLCLVVYAPIVVSRWLLENVAVALPHSIASKMVLDPESDIEMSTGLAFMVVALAQFTWGVLGGVTSCTGAFVLYLVMQTTLNLNADHYSMYMHTETHKYWTPNGTWTFLGRKSPLGLPNVPIMDYLWFITGYPPAWGTVEHAKVHHVWHTMHPLDPDYIFDTPRNSTWAFLGFNLRAWFLNIMDLGILRIYFFWPKAACLRSRKVRSEIERQVPVGLLVLGMVARTNPNMLWFLLFQMLCTNIDLNINTWVQHAFINHDDGTCNAWNSTTLAHEEITWGACAEHLKHHLSPTLSQETYIEWFKSEEAIGLRRKYGFHVFDANDAFLYYSLFWAILSSDYAHLESAWVPIECGKKQDAQEEATPRSAEERAKLMATFQQELESLFAADWGPEQMCAKSVA